MKNYLASEKNSTFYGDDSGSKSTYIYDSGELLLEVSYDEIDKFINKNKLKVLDFSIGCLLRLGFVPAPFTLYKNLYVLSVGDKIQENKSKIVYSTSFPYWEENNTHESEYSDEIISSLLSKSIKKTVDDDIYVMQSGGKDSTTIMIALKEAGYRNVTGITYVAGIREDESNNAKRVAEGFGYDHITVYSDPLAEIGCYKEFCKKNFLITGDFAFLPYIYTLKSIGKMGVTILDGMGNDIYMGHVPSSMETRLQLISLPSLLKGCLWGRGDIYSFGEKFSYLFQSIQMMKSERSFAGSRLSIKDISSIVPNSTVLFDYLKYLESISSNNSTFEKRAFIRGRLYDTSSAMDKGRIATKNINSNIYFPFCTNELRKYFFNFKESEKFDANKRINKLVLRKYIKSHGLSKLKYLQEKGSFRFDVKKFIRVNEKTIIHDMKNASEALNIDVCSVIKKFIKNKNNYIATNQAYLIYITFLWLFEHRELGVSSLPDVKFNVSQKKIEISRDSYG